MSRAADELTGIDSSHQAISAAPIRSNTVPLYLWVGILAVTFAAIGGASDWSWHHSIGRDTLWTPPHIAIYSCAILAGGVCLYLLFQSSVLHNPQFQATSLNVLGLRAPLGVFIAGWGGIAMLASAPFDNWWHAAYGLDVTLASPPHAVLLIGSRAIALGMIFLVLAPMNRAIETGVANLKLLQCIFLYLGGDAIASQMFFIQEFTADVLLHQAKTYILIAAALPVILAAFSEASRFRWTATCIAGIYTFLIVNEIFLFPLFPAQPHLGPVLNPTNCFIPAKFPILLVVSAIALDLLWQQSRQWKSWQISLVSGFLFTSILAAVEWPFANFLMSHASENRFFGTIYFSYDSPPDGFDRLRRFMSPDHGLHLWLGLTIAVLCATISTWVGLAAGRWMRNVKR